MAPGPFQIGLGGELVELLDQERCRPSTLHWLIKAYTGSLAYLEALQRPGSRRHDIDGRPIGEVAEEDRQHARDRLVDHARRAKARHQAELEAKRNLGPASRRIRA